MKIPIPRFDLQRLQELSRSHTEIMKSPTEHFPALKGMKIESPLSRIESAVDELVSTRKDRGKKKAGGIAKAAKAKPVLGTRNRLISGEWGKLDRRGSIQDFRTKALGPLYEKLKKTNPKLAKTFLFKGKLLSTRTLSTIVKQTS